MPAEVHYFGIRHHGPGSARALEEALAALAPARVLIEGPADCSALLPLLASPDMVPPVALLAYPEDAPGDAAFWPFAAFSPEYRAVRWAVANGVTPEFIDLPISWRLWSRAREEDEAEIEDADRPDEDVPPEDGEEDSPAPAFRDPIGTLAAAAGYADGESWWRDVIEENPAPGPVFDAITDAMAALREDAPPPDRLEAAREAHMRLAVAAARKDADGPVAVVCGAWHVPALKAKHTASGDRALLKGAPRRKIAATWAPWTSPRLASASGYGAGVAAPNWCAHLWETREETAVRWLGRIARLLREKGQIVSTASLIETDRLAHTLAALRERPTVGYDELRDAAISCLCFGQRAQWMTIAEELLVGNEVGAIPADVPRAPLLEDLQRQQKATRLKPEALDREVSVDLRSDAGLRRSTLLHRLAVLDVPWGQLTDAGRSRGTFRERWILRWEPEYAVALVENIVHGPTIERAATGRMAAKLSEATTLGDLAGLVRDAMTAQLPDAARHGIDRLGTRAGRTSDCDEMLAALPPMADLVRYGEARSGDTGQMQALMQRIAVQASLALPYAARGLDADTAAALATAMREADGALRLVEMPDDVLSGWEDALETLLTDDRAARLVAGAAAQHLFAAERLEPEEARDLLARMLSPGVPTADAAAYFEGFFDDACQRLIYDADLRGAVDDWLTGLDEESFTGFLPLFRRVFSALDRSERTRLLEAAFGGEGGGLSRMVAVEGAEALWARHLAVLTGILDGDRNGDARDG